MTNRGFENIGNFTGATLLRNQVYEAIKGEIILGNLKAGQTININELAQKMNISTAPVREALNLLDKDGLITLSPHKKAVVSQANQKDFFVVVQLRKILEPFAARLSVNLIPDDRLDSLIEELEDSLENSSDVMKYISSDMKFHETLYKYYGSQVLNDVMSVLRNLQCCYGVERSNEPEEIKIAYRKLYTKQHLEIVRALKARDIDHVEELLLKHLKDYQSSEKYYAAEGDGEGEI